MSILIEQINDKIKSTVEECGCEIVEIAFSKVHGKKNLTVFIDKDGGVSLDDCEKVHLAIDPILDEMDITGDEPYVLNVSSPGLDRPFKTDRDFEKNIGNDVEAKLYAPLKGKKLIEGKLVEKKGNAVVINDGKEDVHIELTRVSVIRLAIKFE